MLSTALRLHDIMLHSSITFKQEVKNVCQEQNKRCILCSENKLKELAGLVVYGLDLFNPITLGLFGRRKTYVKYHFFVIV